MTGSSAHNEVEGLCPAEPDAFAGSLGECALSSLRAMRMLFAPCALGGALALSALLTFAPACAFADEGDPEGQVTSASFMKVSPVVGSDTAASSVQSTAALLAAIDGEELPDYGSMSLDDLKEEVEDKSDECEELKTLLDNLSAKTAENDALLAETSAELTEQEAAAKDAVSDRYKAQRQYPTLIDAVLCSQDWQSFIAGIEYIEAASQASVGEVTQLRGDVAAYEQEQMRLKSETAIGEKKLERAEAELEAATEARDEAQRKADLVANAHLESDDADWDADEEDFVEEWAERIDDYLDGTPMEGTGEAFAQAAWDNHIDPRFSPAISFIESSNGRICIRPHNAWGWGAAEPNPAGLASSWSSWEEAIEDHVRGLKSGYGYTISPKGAKKYCPPNWELWYATTVDQMNSI